MVGIEGVTADGVRDAAVDGVCASATACERDGSVIIGGRAFKGNEGTAGVGEEGCRFRGLGGDRLRFCRTRFGDGGKEFGFGCTLLRAGPFTLSLLEKLLNRL